MRIFPIKVRFFGGHPDVKSGSPLCSFFSSPVKMAVHQKLNYHFHGINSHFYLIKESMSMNTKKIGLLLMAAIFLGFLITPTTTLAKTCEISPCTTTLDCGEGRTCDKISVPNVCTSDTFGLNPVGNKVVGKLGNQDLRETAANLINVLLGILGLIAVVIVLAGGFKWMTAGGNDEKVTEARKMIFSGIIGLAIIMSAWAISLFVINQLSSATGGNADIPDQG